MERIKIKDDLDFSRIIHGYWRLMEWKLSSNELINLIEEAYDLGITTVDHADIYGNFCCEEKFGEALSLKKGLREKLQIVTKCGIKFPSENRPENKSHCYDTSKEHIIKSAERSLKNFNTDYLDALLIHRVDALLNPEEVAEAFHKLKKEGKVRYFGVSNFLPSQFNMLNSYLDNELITNQVEISPLCLNAFEDGTLDLMLEKRVKPMAWSPLAGGKLFNSLDERALRVKKALNKIKEEVGARDIDEVAYAWLLMHPSKIMPIVGSGKIERIKSAVQATEILLTRDQWFEIYVASRGIDIP
ncbi:aldo/keto reductase family oxidoreductase [Clostridium sp. Sa3CUN1]|uniref:Aldo/keto reductase family oxidoreductase n=1 Tax=Clostridium gallinarum TaxID=2762246 RepID=A0ABR8Q7P5_9CLOT|nr:aldo/keto reductase family oxidoreductase [Clostridium gallinarum]MBD7916438.1 aldo/keto reductase family oxidoreductase [Clostridium gallinarum]